MASLEYYSNLALREFAPVDSIEFASKNIHAIDLDCLPFSKSNRCRLIKMQSYKIWGHLIHSSFDPQDSFFIWTANPICNQ